MQFTEKQNFMPEYIERTLVNLQHIEKNVPATYEVTQLLNSFVGLLVLPREKGYDSIEDSDVSQCLLHRIQTAAKLCLDGKRQSEDKSLRNIVRHLRNGICHFEVEFYGNKDIEEIRIIDKYTDENTKKTLRTFDAKFDMKLLREFVIEFGENTKNKHRTSQTKNPTTIAKSGRRTV